METEQQVQELIKQVKDHEKKYTINHAWFEMLLTGYARIGAHPQGQPILKVLNPAEPLTIVEIGVYEGASSCWWSDNFLHHPDSKLISIDPFMGNEDHQQHPDSHPTLGRLEYVAKTNIAKSENPGKVTVVPHASWDVHQYVRDDLLKQGTPQERKVDVLYIDGEHTTRAVMLDMLLYIPMVAKGGLVIIDDYGDEEVKRGVEYMQSALNLFEASFFTGWQLWSIKSLK